MDNPDCCVNVAGILSAYQKSTLNILATSNARHTCVEKPSASRVVHISQYCGMYGTAPPKIIAHDEIHEMRVMMLNSLSSPTLDKCPVSRTTSMGIVSLVINQWIFRTGIPYYFTTQILSDLGQPCFQSAVFPNQIKLTFLPWLTSFGLIAVYLLITREVESKCRSKNSNTSFAFTRSSRLPW